MTTFQILSLISMWCSPDLYGKPASFNCRKEMIQCMDYLTKNTIDTSAEWRIQSCIQQEQILRDSNKKGKTK